MQASVVFQKNWEAIHALDENGERKYRYIINEGSSRSSKTYSLIDCYDLYARANPNKRMTTWRNTKVDCKKTILVDALKHLKKTGRYLVQQTFNRTESTFGYATSSAWEIHGTEDEEAVHGLTQDVAWLNEPYQISREVFDQIDQRTSDFVIVDWNPKKAHWIEDLKKDKRSIVIHSTFMDNPFCPPEQRMKILSYQTVKYAVVVRDGKISEMDAHVYDVAQNKLFFTEKEIAELSRCIENERKGSASDFNWCVYGLGIKSERPNRIYRWNEISHQEYLQLDAPIYYGCDWGAVDPWAIVEAKYYDGALYLHELNYECENMWRGKLTPTELSVINSSEEGIVSWMFGKLGINRESIIICDSNRPLKIIALRRAGWDYALAAVKPSGSIVDGIDLLNNIKVYFTSSSTNLKYEQENYSRKTDRYGVVLEEPEDIDNHTMDTARYIAQFLQKEGIIRNI